MSNNYYSHGSFPSTGSAATSASMRAELDLVTAGFDKLPTLTSNANKFVLVNSTSTGLTATSSLPTSTATDTSFTVQNATDNTKTFQFLASAITAGTLRVYTMPDASTTLVGTTATQTLTNKTLTAPVISSIVNTGVLTLPTSTDTLVGRATTDTLTNKTLVAPALGTPASGDFSSGTFTWPTFNQNTSGTAAGLSATLAIASGGTGATTLAGASIATYAGTETLTNKRIDPRTVSAATATTLTPNVASYDQYAYTALATGLAINAPNGTPVDGNKLIFRILDNGTTQTITWNATFTSMVGTTFTNTFATTAGKMTYFGCIYNLANTRWDVVAVTTQA